MVIAHWVRKCVFFRIRHLFLSKCLLRMQKRRKSNLIRIFYDGRKIRRQCVNVIDASYLFFNVRKLTCAMTFTLSLYMQLSIFYANVFCPQGGNGLGHCFTVKKRSIKTDKNKQPKRLASVHNSLQREAPASDVTRHNSTFTHVWLFPETSDNKSL